MIDHDLWKTPSFLVKRVAHELMRQGEARLRPLGLGMAYLPILVAIKNGDATTQADLARLLQVEQPSMAQMLARMERDGLVQRKPNPAHKRTQIVSLTEAAIAGLPQARAALHADNQKALSGFSDEETAQFVHFLERANANLRAGDRS